MTTPAQLGYRMPAEWEAHRATWLAWPHKEASWPGKLASIPPVWVQMITALTQGEDVHLLFPTDEIKASAETFLQKAGALSPRLHLHLIPTNDSWMRDIGPIFITRDNAGKRELAITDWGYNAWGGKYSPWDDDDATPQRLADLLKLPRFSPAMVLEGGSIDVNGAGLLLTSEACLLHPNRNPQLSKAQIETTLMAYLGVKKILWLGDGIVGDDTDGHIDDIARFVGPRTIVAAIEEDVADDNYKLLQDNLERLSVMTDISGEPLEIIPLPMPGPVYHEGQRLPASYANFYIGNAVVLVPTYRHPNDTRALAILQSCFPTRNVIGIDCTDMIWGLGAIHCVTQQEPAV